MSTASIWLVRPISGLVIYCNIGLNVYFFYIAKNGKNIFITSSSNIIPCTRSHIKPLDVTHLGKKWIGYGIFFLCNSIALDKIHNVKCIC